MSLVASGRRDIDDAGRREHGMPTIADWEYRLSAAFGYVSLAACAFGIVALVA
jgi:hypothetical protein